MFADRISQENLVDYKQIIVTSGLEWCLSAPPFWSLHGLEEKSAFILWYIQNVSLYILGLVWFRVFLSSVDRKVKSYFEQSDTLSFFLWSVVGFFILFRNINVAFVDECSWQKCKCYKIFMAQLAGKYISFQRRNSNFLSPSQKADKIGS